MDYNQSWASRGKIFVIVFLLNFSPYLICQIHISTHLTLQSLHLLHKSFCGQRALKKLPLSYVLTKQLILRCNLRWQLDKYIYIYRVAKKSWPTCDKVHVWPIYFGPEEICIFNIFNLELIFSFQFC